MKFVLTLVLIVFMTCIRAETEPKYEDNYYEGIGYHNWYSNNIISIQCKFLYFLILNIRHFR
jgi:hypothetical protein